MGTSADTESQTQAQSFEQAFEELETIVESLESERQPLEDLTKIYRRGMQLLHHCQELLDTARQRVEEVRLPDFPNSPTQPSEVSSTQPSSIQEDDSDDEIRLF